MMGWVLRCKLYSTDSQYRLETMAVVEQKRFRDSMVIKVEARHQIVTLGRGEQSSVECPRQGTER